MLRPFIERRRISKRQGERGVTMALVALAITAIVAMAGMSIDIGTLYQASTEAQRAADAGALAGARILSMSGMTGDPTNASGDWTNACAAATNAATTAADQNLISGSAPGTVSVTFLSSDAGGRSPSNCSSTGAVAFGVNPMVAVQVTQTGLPTFFSRIWGRTGSSVSASAIAEAFNPSASQNFSPSADVIPVQPRCVKPWIVPNADPINGTTFLSPIDSSITHQGINPTSAPGLGVIGEKFQLRSDCGTTPGSCSPLAPNPPTATAGPPAILYYVPATVSSTPVAVPSCATANPYQEAIAGCDENTAYQCGVQSASASSPTTVDFSENPGSTSGDTDTATECLIHNSGGQDSMNTGVFPFQITAGAGNPLKVSGSQITSSDSIVSLPIYDSSTPPVTLLTPANNKVTIVGFLQVFIDQVTGGANGHVHVTVLNVAGCGNGLTATVSSSALTGTSPVPVRLITPP